MTENLAVDRVVAVLVRSGFTVHGRRILIGGVQFEFPSILRGRERSPDLVIVLDSIEQPDIEYTKRQIEAFGRALDSMRSKLSVTLVVVGPSPSPKYIDQMTSVGRVLLVGSPSGPDAERVVTDAVAVLLPLDLPEGLGDGIDPITAFERRMGAADAVSARLLDAATQGEHTVADVLKELLSAPFDAEDSDG